MFNSQLICNTTIGTDPGWEDPHQGDPYQEDPY